MPASWYELADPIPSDPFEIFSAVTAGGWFKKRLPIETVAGNAAKAFVPLAKASFDDILAAGAGGEIVESIQLNQEKANSLRAMLSIGIDRPGSFAAAPPPVVASGGSLNRILSAHQIGGRQERIVHSIECRGANGAEGRSYILCSFIYPVKLLFKCLRTQAEFNNKVLTPAAGRKWKMLDLESNTPDVGLMESHRDDDYIYFIEDATSPNAYRISYRGGPWQRLTAGGRWATVYPKMLAF